MEKVKIELKPDSAIILLSFIQEFIPEAIGSLDPLKESVKEFSDQLVTLNVAFILAMDLSWWWFFVLQLGYHVIFEITYNKIK